MNRMQDIKLNFKSRPAHQLNPLKTPSFQGIFAVPEAFDTTIRFFVFANRK